MKPDLGSLLAYWIPRLRLGHWEVRADYARHLDALGRVTFHQNSRTAVIRVRDPIDWRDETWELDPHGVERVILHELGHLLFVPFGFQSDTREDTLEEQTINAYAAALIATKYGPEKNMPLKSGKQNIGPNIKTEMSKGKPKDQAIAIALRKGGVPPKKDAGKGGGKKGNPY